jgi:hypothetical protein
MKELTHLLSSDKWKEITIVLIPDPNEPGKYRYTSAQGRTEDAVAQVKAQVSPDVDIDNLFGDVFK